MTLPKDKEEEDLMDDVFWNFLRKYYPENETKRNEVHLPWTSAAANTKLVNVEEGMESEVTSDSRLQRYPPNGKVDLFHPWTGEPLPDYRGDLVYPASGTSYKYPQLCLFCLASRKKPIAGNFRNDRLKPMCTARLCSSRDAIPLICIFSKKPTFTVRGLCKDAVMDTQYKFADHEPGPFGRGKDDYRSFVGPKGWIISRNKTDKKWRMTHYHYTEMSLTLLSSDALPVGRHKWLVENNVCQEGKTSTEILQVSGCEEGQFTCDDGKCLQV